MLYLTYKEETMASLNELKRHLKPGKVYRRADLVKWSNAVDRHLAQLVKNGNLEKLSPGLYMCLRQQYLEMFLLMNTP